VKSTCYNGSLAVAIWLCVHASVVHAQTADAAPLASAPSSKITDVDIEGLRRVDAEAALSGLKLTRGALFDASVATEDLRRVWATGFFKDVKLEQEYSAAGLRLIYSVIEKPYVRRVTLLGLDALSEDDVKAVMNVKPFTVLNTELLKRNTEKIKDLYVGKGYYLAEANFHVAPVGTQGFEVDITFEISERDKVMVREITFLGNKHLDAQELKAAMQTREGSELSWLTQAGTYKEEFFQTDLMRLQSLYYDRGFVTVKFGEPTATISKDRRYIYLSIPVEEGEQFKVGQVSFSGDVNLEDEDGHPVIDANRLRERLKIVPGAVFNRTQMFGDIQSMTDVYRDYGYAYANVTPNSQINPQTREVNLDLEVERGDIVTIERIEVSGNGRTRDKVVRRELRIYEGERFSNADLNLSRARVYQLGYFETVNLVTSRGSRPDTMNVTVEIKEKSTGTFQIGAGFSSIENFIATAQISQNNFLGNGQLLSLSMQLSFGEYARHLVTLQFYEPYFLDSNFSFGFNGYITQRYYRDFQKDSQGFAPNFGYPLTHELRLSAGYTLEWAKIRTQERNEGQLFLHDLNRDGRVSSLNAALTYDSRDNRLFPRRGMFHEARFELSSPTLGATGAFAFKRTDLTFRIYEPMGFGLVFRANAQLGLITGGDDTFGVPISERYFPGGITSVRGFSPRDLGSKRRIIGDRNDPSAGTRDFIYGGNKQAILNLEIEFPIVPQANVKGVVFVDAGNAYNDDEGFFYAGVPDIQRDRGYLMGSAREIQLPLGLYYSFGFGVRWLSPIGPLRFEWGIPITKAAARDRNVVFEFTIGNFF
jgi:outer membrane protein insertion porin family